MTHCVSVGVRRPERVAAEANLLVYACLRMRTQKCSHSNSTMNMLRLPRLRPTHATLPTPLAPALPHRACAPAPRPQLQA